jgi:coatomer protein complex subunit gamma
MEEDPQAGRTFYDYLEGWLRHKSDMVTYEAARAICSLKDVTARELYPAVAGFIHFDC